MRSDFLWVLGGRIFLAIASLVSIRCISYFLSPSQYGELAIIIAVQTMCGFLIVNPLCQHLNRFTHQWWQDNTLLPRLKSFSMYMIFASIVGVIFCFFLKYNANPVRMIMTSTAVFAMVLAVSWNGALVHLLNMLGFRHSAVIWGAVSVIVALASSILLFLQFADILAWYIGQALGMMVGAIGAIYKIINESKVRVASIQKMPFLDWHSAKFYCLPLAIATGFMWLQWSGWRFIVEHYWSLSLLGYMVMGVTIAAQVWAVFESLAMQFLFPLFFHRIAHGNQKNMAFSDVLNVLGPVYLVLAGAIILVSPQILSILADSTYSSAAFFLMCAVLIEACRVLSNLFALAVQVTGKTIVLSIPFIVGAMGVFIGVYSLGEQNESIHYVMISMVFAAIIMLILMIFIMYKQIAFILDIKRWLSGLLIALFLITLKDFYYIPVLSIASLVSLLIVGLICICSFFLLLWRNPALERLLAVRL